MDDFLFLKKLDFPQPLCNILSSDPNLDLPPQMEILWLLPSVYHRSQNKSLIIRNCPLRFCMCKPVDPSLYLFLVLFLRLFFFCFLICFVFFLFVFIWFCFIIILDACLFFNEREKRQGVDLSVRGGGRIWGVERGKTIVKIYYLEKKLFPFKKEEIPLSKAI